MSDTFDMTDSRDVERIIRFDGGASKPPLVVVTWWDMGGFVELETVLPARLAVDAEECAMITGKTNTNQRIEKTSVGL